MSDFPDDRNDWVQYSGLDERQRPLMRRRPSTKARIFFSVFLIVAGVLLFLSNLGILPVHDVWTFWPLLPIAAGFGRLMSRASASARVWGFFLLLFGCLFLLLNLGWIHIQAKDGSWPFSLLLIAVGFAALFSVLDSSRRPRNGPRQGAAWQRTMESYEHAVNDFAVFGALKRKLETPAFEGGELTTIFGNIEIDLRHAMIAPADRSAVLNVTAVFGAIKIRVPQTWRVHVSGAGILGNFEDKTIPPNTGPDAPSLVITGFSVFGSVEVED